MKIASATLLLLVLGGTTTAPTEMLPRLTPETLGDKNLLWPLDPQDPLTTPSK